MSGTQAKNLGLVERYLPLALACLGAAVVVWSVPGQGKTGGTALGMSIAFVGVALGRSFARDRRDG